MSIIKAAGVGVLAVGASVTAVEVGVAVEVVKHVGTVLGAAWTLAKVVQGGYRCVQAILQWANTHVRAAVREEMDARFEKLPCVQTGGALCDVEGELSKGR